MNALSPPGKLERVFWPVLASALLLTLWYASVRWSGTKVFPSPYEVEKGMAELLRHHVLWRDIVDSLRRVAVGFGAAALLGIPLGLILGWYPAANQVVNPVMQILRPISPIAWIPVAIIFFGIGDRAAIFLIFLGAFFPIVVACVNGVSNVPSVYRRAGRNFGLSPSQLLSKVLFRATHRSRNCMAGGGGSGDDCRRFRAGLPRDRFAQLRQALRPCGCGHSDDRFDRPASRYGLSPARKAQLGSLGVPW